MNWLPLKKEIVTRFSKTFKEVHRKEIQRWAFRALVLSQIVIIHPIIN